MARREQGVRRAGRLARSLGVPMLVGIEGSAEALVAGNRFVYQSLRRGASLAQRGGHIADRAVDRVYGHGVLL